MKNSVMEMLMLELISIQLCIDKPDQNPNVTGDEIENYLKRKGKTHMGCGEQLHKTKLLLPILLSHSPKLKLKISMESLKKKLISILV